MIFTINDLNLYYEDIGSGTPVIIIHGFTLDHRSMKACMEPIFEAYEGWRRIYLDLPGHGKTKGSELNRSFPTSVSLSQVYHMVDNCDSHTAIWLYF